MYVSNLEGWLDINIIKITGSACTVLICQNQLQMPFMISINDIILSENIAA